MNTTFAKEAYVQQAPARWFDEERNELRVYGMVRVLDPLSLLTLLAQDRDAVAWVKPQRGEGYWPCKRCLTESRWAFPPDPHCAALFVGKPRSMPSQRFCYCGTSTYKVSRSKA